MSQGPHPALSTTFNLLMTLNLPELLVTQRSYQPYFIGRQKPQVVSSELLKIKLEILGRTQVSEDLQDCFLLKQLHDN